MSWDILIGLCLDIQSDSFQSFGGTDIDGYHFNLWLPYDLLLTFLTGVLETGDSVAATMASMVLSDKQMKGFEC
jgi:hypothetical protein